jgi:YHS domain-containing protein
MKKFSFLSVIVLLFAASCNMKASTDDNKTEEKPAAVTTTTTEQPKTAAALDPVCGMEKDNTWTEYSVTGTDTTWFCSPHCKETFAKNPEKYSKKEEPKKG